MPPMAEKQQKERNQDMQETPQIEEATSITLATQYPPMRILEVELGEALPMLSSFDERTEKHYQRALCTIRLHTHPLGTPHLECLTQPDQRSFARGWTSSRLSIRCNGSSKHDYPCLRTGS